MHGLALGRDRLVTRFMRIGFMRREAALRVYTRHVKYSRLMRE